MDQHAGMREGAALAGSTRAQQHGAHRSGHAGADRRHVGLDQLHGVIDPETRRNLTARCIEIQGNIRGRIRGSQEQELGLDDVGHVVVDRDAEEDDAVHHQPAEHVHRSDIELALLDDLRVDVGIHRALITMQGHGTDTITLDRESVEFVSFHFQLFEFTELLDADLLGSLGNDLLDGGDDLLLLDALGDAAHLVFVLHDILGSALQELLRDIAHAVHRILVSHVSLGSLTQVLVLHLQTILAHQVVADDLPAEIGGEARIVGIDLLGGELTLVDMQQPALQESIRKLNVSLLHQIVTDILGQAVVSLLLVVGSELGGNSLVELLGAVDLVLTEETVIGFLALDGSHKGADRLDGGVENRVDAREFLFLDLEHGSAVGLIGESRIDIDVELVARLGTDEKLVGVALDIANGDVSTFHLLLAIVQVSDDEVFLTGLPGILEGTGLL